MNNIYYDIPSNWYNEFNDTFSIYNPNIENNTKNNSILANPNTALDRGNLFNNIYSPYKNYRYSELKPTNKLEEILYKYLQYDFALTDIDLYLDTHPFDKELIDLYNKYLIAKKQLINEYEQNFGPLTLDSNYLQGNTWKWIEKNWPWEGTK